MTGYKGFHKDLTCTMGKGTFRYDPGRWYSEGEARCASTGFHATDNPLDVLSYYGREDDRYFLVQLRGNVDEDGVDSRISAPEIMLVRELTRDELYREGVLWMAQHPKAPWAAAVAEEAGDAAGEGNVAVRGRRPKAKGEEGDNLYLIREDDAGDIVEIGHYRIDGKGFLPGVYYDVKGGICREQEGTGEAEDAPCHPCHDSCTGGAGKGKIRV